ncbi:MAG: beta-propeller repeat-containing protein [Acidobacteriales bacterium]|nr:beta-propeller repeat-containing protein [Terriglobales bacterium]
MRLFNKLSIVMAFLLIAVVASYGADKSTKTFKVINKIAVEGAGRWDYLVIDPETRRLFMSRATHVSVLDADSGAVVGDIPNTPGVHGITLAPELGVGFISAGGDDSVIAFDLKSLQPVAKIPAGGNPDSMLYDSATKSLFVQNGKGNTTTVIDAAARKVVATIPMVGRPEFIVADNKGNAYVNIEDKSMLAVIDIAGKKVKKTWQLKPCEEPTGLAIDNASRTLFSACANKMLAVVNADSGKVLQTLPIGEDTDAVAFDPKTGFIFASSGDGKLSIFKKGSAGKYATVQEVESMPGSKTMTLDSGKHLIYVPSAKFTGSPTGHPRPAVVPGSISILVIGE